MSDVITTRSSARDHAQSPIRSGRTDGAGIGRGAVVCDRGLRGGVLAETWSSRRYYRRCRSSLTLNSLRSEDIEGTNKMKVSARITGLGRQDEALEQLVVRLSLEAGVSSVPWAVHTKVPE